jgi:hypothetical protein
MEPTTAFEAEARNVTLRYPIRAAHHATRTRRAIQITGRREQPMETAVGIILILIAAIEMIAIVRIVQSNMGRA